MEKIRIFLFSIIIVIVGILVFSLAKSWLVYDQGIQDIPVKKEKLDEKLEQQKIESIEDWQDNSKIYWKYALIYPLGLSTESGGLGPDGVMNHAKNLITVNLQTGKSRKLFPKNVYIWDYFQAVFNRKSGFTTSDEPRIDSLNLEYKILIFAATQDTNMDGFLNNKDKKKVFLYDTEKDRLIEVLSADGYFEKLLWNAGSNRLALVIRKGKISSSDKPGYEFSHPLLFIFDANTNRRTTVEIVE